ncbi:hypothetical protein LMK08_16625 [Metapseudomonas furukawaii]|uniref:hypothetical protein n=1 Tax=Metapseudomonas furukawaii TaxID=1149133 RepID=UPI00227BB46F|nr:hypothetical protein [Pseudomonas furukawaii]WAG77000.1 hypothetical protein LMK08_16625 [Pseudomonas furukawaii]
MRRILMAFIAVAAIGAFGFAGHLYWQDHQSKESLRLAAKSISVRLDKVSNDLSNDTNITYGEFATLISESVKAIDNTVFDIKTAEAKHQSPLTADVERYAVASQRLLRTLLTFTRESVGVRTQESNAKEALAELKTISSVDERYRWDHLMETATKSTTKMGEHAILVSEAAEEAVSEIEAVKVASRALGQSLGQDITASGDSLSRLAERMKGEFKPKEEKPES